MKKDITSKILIVAIAIMFVASSLIFLPGAFQPSSQNQGYYWLKDYKCAVSEGIDPHAIIFIYSPMYCKECDAALKEVNYWKNQSITFIKIDYTDKNNTEFKKVLGCYGKYLSNSVPLIFCASDPKLGFVGRAPSRDLMENFIYLCRSRADKASEYVASENQSSKK